MEASFLVVIIITLVAFFIISTVIYRFLAKAEEKEAEILCHDSIAMRASTALQINMGKEADDSDFDLIQATLKTAPVLCKTIDKKVKGDKQEVMKAVADKIARCWWMFGEGRYEEILQGGEFHFAPAILGMDNEENKCFNCYNLMIDEDDIEGGSIAYSELVDYMWNTPYLKRVYKCKEGEGCKECTINADCGEGVECHKGHCDQIQSINYFQYIQSYGGPGMFVNIVEGSIQPRHAYAVSMLPKTREKEQTNWLKWIGTAVTAVLAVGCTVVSAGTCAAIVVPAIKIVGTVTVGAYAYEGVQGGVLPDEKEAPTTGAPDCSKTNECPSVETMFKERGYSSVYLSDSKYGQAFCGSGDLAGD